MECDALKQKKKVVRHAAPGLQMNQIMLSSMLRIEQLTDQFTVYEILAARCTRLFSRCASQG